MEKEEQKKFIMEVLKNVNFSLQRCIDNGNIPKRWTGKELRLWIADYIKGNYAYYKMSKEEIKTYNNDLLVNPNLI